MLTQETPRILSPLVPPILSRHLTHSIAAAIIDRRQCCTSRETCCRFRKVVGFPSVARVLQRLVGSVPKSQDNQSSKLKAAQLNNRSCLATGPANVTSLGIRSSRGAYENSPRSIAITCLSHSSSPHLFFCQHYYSGQWIP